MREKKTKEVGYTYTCQCSEVEDKRGGKKNVN
jgi:hypothetical protein